MTRSARQSWHQELPARAGRAALTRTLDAAIAGGRVLDVNCAQEGPTKPKSGVSAETEVTTVIEARWGRRGRYKAHNPKVAGSKVADSNPAPQP